MAGDLNREASELWNSLKPIIDKEIDSRTQGMVQRRKAKVTTAPSLATNTIGVTEPFGPEMFLPFNTNIMSASVGDFVWVEYMYGMTNAFVSMFASADDKNQYVAGNLTVDGVLDVPPRRCYASLSSAGWYRVLSFDTSDGAIARGYDGQCIDFTITRQSAGAYGEIHKISYMAYLDSWSFVNEVSKSGVLAIDKIRYTRDSEKGHVDIHFNLSASMGVQVDYDVHTQQTDKALYKSENLTAVAASPGGETVLTEYMFNANGMGDLNVNGTVAGQGFADLLFGIGNSIPSNTNCNSLTSEGKYTCASVAIAGTLTNSPYTDFAFGMLVIRVAEAQRFVQVAMPNSTAITIKLRYYNGTSWTAWKTLTPS